MKTRQKLWLIAITALLLTLLFALCASAETVSGDCGKTSSDAVTWSLDTETGVLTISGTGNMVNYADVANRPWNDYATSITEIIVEEGVTGIGNRAFRDLTNVTKISLPEGLLLIDQYALKGCTGLSELTLPSTLTTLNYQALNGCKGLTSLVVPASVKTVGNQVFSSSSNLATVVYLSTDTTFGTGSLTFPETTVIYLLRGLHRTNLCNGT